MKIPLIGILTYNRADLLSRCVNSIDHAADKIVFINNGDDRDVYDTITAFQKAHRNVDVYHNRIGMGVAGSWNFLIKRYKVPYWFIVGSDIYLKPGALKLLLEFTNKNHQEYAIIGGNQGMNFCFLTKSGIDCVGLFDENFYPAYFEDTDFRYRIKLANAKMYWLGDAQGIHGEAPHWGSSTVNSDPLLGEANTITYSNNKEYYFKKWGGDHPNERFTNPFNRRDLSIRDWTLDPVMRKKNSLW
jgi:GT2 family glycosyltransferase